MRILIIEDDMTLSKVMKEGLEKAGFQTVVSNSGNDGEELAYVEDFDAILLDLNLPDKDGIDILQFLRKENVLTPIIIVTARDEVKQRALGLDYGADDYITKPFDFIELVARLHAVMRRAQGRANASVVIGDLHITPQQKQVTVKGESIPLSVKEYEIIEYLAINQGKIVSNEELALQLYGEDFDPFSSVLRVHIANVRKKLKKADLTEEVLQTIKGRGYKL